MSRHRAGYGTYRYFYRKARNSRNMQHGSDSAFSAFSFPAAIVTAILWVVKVPLFGALCVGAVVGGVVALIVSLNDKDRLRLAPIHGSMLILASKLKLGSEIILCYNVGYDGRNPSLPVADPVMLGLYDRGLTMGYSGAQWAIHSSAIQIEDQKKGILNVKVASNKGQFSFTISPNWFIRRKILKWYQQKAMAHT